MSALTRLVVVVVILTALAPSAFATDGDHSVYLSRDSQGRYRPTIELGGSARVLANVDSIGTPALSPNGARVAFSGVVGNGSLGRYALFLVDSTGGGLVQLTDGEFAEFDPAWINSTTIVFSQNVTGSIGAGCCRLASVNVSNGQMNVLSQNVGVQRPAAVSGGQFVFWDNSSGVWRIRNSGGSATLIGPGGYDATVSTDESMVAYLANTGTSTQLRRVSSQGGNVTQLYSTTNRIENPVWSGGRIFFTEYAGLGYDGRRFVSLRSVSQAGGPARTERTLPGSPVEYTPGRDGEEVFFYRPDGLFRYYDIRPDGTLPSPLSGGSSYTSGWSSIASVNLDGGSDDELFFYREDGLFRYYNVRGDGGLPKPWASGSNYTPGWDAITAVDLDGDGQDEMFFYRRDGLYRYYDIRPNGVIPKPMRAGSDYTQNWDAITAVDLDGDGQDEMFFYRRDGLFRFYDVSATGALGNPIREGDSFDENLSWVSAIDLDGDGSDEMLMYRSNGTYSYQDLLPNGQFGSVILSGDNYTSGWTIITSVRLPS